jgi:hypothetical protein
MRRQTTAKHHSPQKRKNKYEKCVRKLKAGEADIAAATLLSSLAFFLPPSFYCLWTVTWS